MDSSTIPLDTADEKTSVSPAAHSPGTAAGVDDMTDVTDTDQGQGERRSSPRRQMPLGPAFHADLVVLGRQLSLSIDDLSQGGVALRATRAEAGALLVGRKLPQVLLTLGGYGSLMVSLEVRSRRSFKSFLAGEQVYLGCSFIGLNAATQARLQTLIDRLLSPGA